MPYRNISSEIHPKVMSKILNAISEIHTQLPFLINLTPEERQRLPKMGDKTLGFVTKALELSKRYPKLVPKYLDIAHL